MNDGNTDAINRHLAEREEHDAWQEGLDAIEALADADERIEELETKLAKLEAERDTVYREGFDDGCNHMKEDYKAGESLDNKRAEAAETKLAKAEAERDDYASKLMEANNTYTEMHLKIEYAEAQLAAMTAERELYRNHLSQAEAQVERLLDLTTRIDARAEAAEAAIPRAYAMGLEAAAAHVGVWKIPMSDTANAACGLPPVGQQAADAIRAMTPPADLVERVLKTKEQGNENE